MKERVNYVPINKEVKRERKMLHINKGRKEKEAEYGYESVYSVPDSPMPEKQGKKELTLKECSSKATLIIIEGIIIKSSLQNK